MPFLARRDYTNDDTALASLKCHQCARLTEPDWPEYLVACGNYCTSVARLAFKAKILEYLVILHKEVMTWLAADPGCGRARKTVSPPKHRFAEGAQR